MRIDSAMPHVPAGQLKRQPNVEDILTPDQDKAAKQQPVQEISGTQQQDCEGVLRLLQEGHFKGVADVRLRINFHEEIAALEQQNINEQAAQNTNELKTEVSDSATSMITQASLPQEKTDEAMALVNDFETAVDDALSTFQNEQDSTLEQLTANIQDAYNYFISSLNAILNPAPLEPLDEAGIEGEQDIELLGLPQEPILELTSENQEELLTEDLMATLPVPEDTLEFEPPVVPELPLWQTELNGIFSAALERFSTLMNSAPSLLPPISDPSGNGKAFDKFMAIYNDMSNEATLDVIETEPEPLPA